MAKKTAKTKTDKVSEPIYGCAVKQLTDDLLLEAAATAVDQNPANQPDPTFLSTVLSAKAYSDVIEPQAIAVLTSKYWGSKGVKLGVSFMENTVPELRDKIISHMNAWSEQANVQFAYSQSNGEVRISRGQGGYWSYLGTDVLHIPKGQQTMNLEGFVLNTPLSEYKRVVRHETGHTLGFPHEHMRKDLVALLDVAKTIAYFQRTQGWSQQEVRDQVLSPLDEGALMATPVDDTSIMCYQLPGSITKSGKPIPGGLDINPTDFAFAAKLYPKAVVPPPVNPPDPNPGVVTVGSIRIDLTKKKIFFPEGSSWTAEAGV